MFKAKGNTTQVAAIKAYREKIESELAGSESGLCFLLSACWALIRPACPVCEDILKVLDDHLIKSAESGESKVRSSWSWRRTHIS